MKKLIESSFKSSTTMLIMLVLMVMIISVSSCKKDEDEPEVTKYKVTLVRNNGQADTIVLVTDGGKMTEPADPVKATSGTGDEYQFDAWYSTSDLTGDPFDFGTSLITADISLYAKYLATVKVTFHSLKQDGSADTTFVVVANQGETILLSELPLPRKESENKFFAGWFDAATGGNEFTETTIVNTSLEVWYQLEHTNYKVWELDDVNRTCAIGGGYIAGSPDQITNVTTFAPPAKIGVYRIKQVGRDMFYPVDDGSNKNTLTTVVLPEGVEQIYGGSFRNCSALTSVTIPSTVNVIDGPVFWGCSSLQSITLPEGLTYLSVNLFVNAGITSIVIPSTVTQIRDAAFLGSKLTSASIPDNVKWIGMNAFLGCQELTSLSFNKETSKLDSIGQGAFAECHKFASVTFPNSLKKITGFNAFINCLKLTSVTIPANVEYIGGGTFALCDDLETAIFEGVNPPYLGDGVFNKRGSGEVTITKILIKVPVGSLNTYLTTENGPSWQYWRDGIHGDIVEITN